MSSLNFEGNCSEVKYKGTLSFVGLAEKDELIIWSELKRKDAFDVFEVQKITRVKKLTPAW